MAFRYVSAGVTPSDLLISIFIKYETNPTLTKIEVIEDMSQRLTTIRTPDRTLYMTNRDSKWFPDFEFDEYISPNIYEHHSVPSKYCKYILFSAHNCKKVKKQEIPEWKTNKELTVMVDSGGAQLRFGTAKYVDPYSVIQVYNKSANIAVALDVPPRPCDKGNLEAIKMLARGQHKCTQIFKKEVDKDRVKDGSLRFLNTCHGFDVKERRAWTKEVDDEFFSGWAIPFDSLNFYNNILGVLVPIIEAKKTKNKFLHVLGVSGGKMFPILSWMGKYIELVTSDSSQHIHTAIRAKQFENFVPTGKVAQYKMGHTPLTDGDGKIRVDIIDYTYAVEVPCGCPLCSRIKYAAAYSLDSTTGASNALSSHNMINNAKRSQWWNDQAQKLNLVEFKALVKKHYTKDKVKLILTSLDIVESAFKHGIDKTEKKFDSLINGDIALLHSDLKPFFAETKKTEKKAAMENLKHKDSAVFENLPNYLDYEELKHMMSKEQYLLCKYQTIHFKLVGSRGSKKATTVKLEDIIAQYEGKISLKGLKLLKPEFEKSFIKAAKEAEKQSKRDAKKKAKDDKANNGGSTKSKKSNVSSKGSKGKAKKSKTK